MLHVLEFSYNFYRMKIMSVANYDKLNPHILEEKKVESTFQLHFQGTRFPE